MRVPADGAGSVGTRETGHVHAVGTLNLGDEAVSGDGGRKGSDRGEGVAHLDDCWHISDGGLEEKSQTGEKA